MGKIHTPTAVSLLFVLVSLITVAVYQPGLAGDYVFDDMPNLLHNKRLELDSLDMESLWGAAFSSGAGTLRRPVSMASFALNRYLYGTDPYSYKVVNLAIHLLTGLALFLFGRLLLRACRLTRHPDLPETTLIWLPLTASALWLVHPLNLTSVLYIVQRMTSLATLFMVLGLCLFTLGRVRMFEDKPGFVLILAGLLGCGGLAVLSKESGALLPLYMLAVEITLFGFRKGNGRADKTIIAFFVAAVAVPAGLCLLYLATNPSIILGGYAGRDFNLTERLLTESRVLLFYLKMIVIPSLTELGLYHDDIALSHGLLDPPATLYSLIVLAALLVVALLLLRKWPLISLGISWFFVGHLMESTILPLEIAHEHRNYLADYGVILAISSVLTFARPARLAPLVKFAVPALFLLFSTTTWLRAAQWSDNINQAIYEAMHHPKSFRAVFAAGRIYGRLAIQGQVDSVDKAFDYLSRAGELNVTGIMPEVTKIKLAYVLGRPVEADWFEKVIDKLSRHPVTASDIESLKELVNCIGDICDIPADTMEAMFEQANRYEDAQLLALYGYYTINERGNFHKGLSLFERAVELRPREPQYWINLIRLLVAMGMPDEAERKLALFKGADTHGGNARDYDDLQERIDSLRNTYSFPGRASTSARS